MNNKLDIITIGESLIELSTSENITNAEFLAKYYGGDTLTTAISALRMGSKVGFISRIGMDCFRNYLLESWQDEGLDISHVKPVQGVNGIYVLSESENTGLKEYSFYRKKTAATNLSIEDISPDYIKSAGILYATGITQSLSISAAEAVKSALKIAKENNVITSYDPNFNPKIWSLDEAKEAFKEIAEYIDIIFLNAKNDLQVVSDVDSIDNTIKQLWDAGISTVIVRSTSDLTYYAGYQGQIEQVKFFEDEIIDNTGAGDAFNGGFLHALSSGMPTIKSVNFASVLSGIQVKNFGAVKSIPCREEVYKIFKGENA